MHISIAGKLGSGKSTICNILRERYGFTVYSTGAILREIAAQQNVSALEINQILVGDATIDNEIDAAVTKLSIEKNDEVIIFDSRMAWKFANNSFKVYVEVDPAEAARRVFGAKRGAVEEYTSAEDAQEKLIKRSLVENERFKQIYGVDNFDHANYDLVIDSTNATPQEMADIIYAKYQERVS